MSSQLVKGVSDALGGCGFYSDRFRGYCSLINRLIRKGVNAGVNGIINQIKKRL